MKESFSSPEGEKQITRGKVIDAYKELVARGITNPDDLDLQDPEVKRAHELFDKWQAQEDARSEGNMELRRQANLSKTMLYVDAGFTDPEYLDEVLHDWLIQDAEDVKERTDNLERSETRRQIAAAMKKVRSLLSLLEEKKQ